MGLWPYCESGTPRATSERLRIRSRDVRRALVPCLIVTAVTVAGMLNRGLLHEIWLRLDQLSSINLVALVGCTALVVALRAITLAIATPGLRFGHAMAADQAAVGATNGVVVGGGAVGAAAKVAMMRSWGVSSGSAGASVVATAVMPGFVTWGLAALVHLPALSEGNATWPETIATISGVVVVVGAALFWFALLALSAPAAFLTRTAARLHGATCRVTEHRMRRAHARLVRHDPERFGIELRLELAELIRRRGLALLLGCLGYAAASFVTLWCTVSVVGVDGVSFFELLSCFTMVRVLVAVAPVPGGVGVAEVGLVTLLGDAGADRAGAAGAVVLFRAATWLVPIVTGAIGWTWWHRGRTDVSPLPAA